jgi:hypothetical protein
MLAIGSDTLVTLTGHMDTVTGSYINNATVTAAVYDGETLLFSTTLAYVSASNGNYRGSFTALQTATLTPDTNYTMVYTADSASGTLVIHQTEFAGYVD